MNFTKNETLIRIHTVFDTLLAAAAITTTRISQSLKKP
jgi:hypothetical protein